MIFATGVEAASITLSIAAVAISILAVWYTRQQTVAIHTENAPEIIGELHGRGVNQSSGDCVITITFVGKQQIDSAVISLRPGSGLDRIALPGTTAAAAGTSIRLTDITPGSPIEFPGLASNFSTGKIRVVMKGRGVGRVARNVDLTNRTLFAY